MRFINTIHEPIALTLAKVLYTVAACVCIGLVFFYELRSMLGQGNHYRVEYIAKSIPPPAILFRAKKMPNISYSIKISPMMRDGYYYRNVDDSNITSTIYLDQDNNTNKSEPSQNEILGRGAYQASWDANDSEYFMPLLQLSSKVALVPYTFHQPIKQSAGSIFIHGFNITVTAYNKNKAPQMINDAIRYKIDMVLVGNPEQITNREELKILFNSTHPNYNTKLMLGNQTRAVVGIKRSEIENDDDGTTRVDYDFKLNDVNTIDPASTEFNFIPFLNKVSPNGENFIVERAVAHRSFSWISTAGILGGICFLMLAWFVFLFGQSRLRPWGVVQRYLMRSQILGMLPASMVSLSSNYRLPESKSSNTTMITDRLATNILNPARNNIITNRVPNPVEDQSELTIVVPDNMPAQSSPNHRSAPHANELSALKEAMAHQKTQMEMQTSQMNLQINQLKQMLTQLVTRNHRSSLDDIVLLPDALLGNDRQPTNALAHHAPEEMIISLASPSTSEPSSFESRLSNLEVFQYRLNSFYIESDLFKDASYKS